MASPKIAHIYWVFTSMVTTGRIPEPEGLERLERDFRRKPEGSNPDCVVTAHTENDHPKSVNGTYRDCHERIMRSPN
jgi:hypothetical protein